MSPLSTSVPPNPIVLTDSHPVEDKQSLFVLYYRQGGNPHSLTKHFFHTVKLTDNKTIDMRPILARAQRFCENTGKKFIRVDPFISNLEQEEKNYAQ